MPVVCFGFVINVLTKCQWVVSSRTRRLYLYLLQYLHEHAKRLWLSCTRSNYKKVFETVRCASRGSSSSAGSSPIHQMYPTHSIHLPTVGGGTVMQTTATLSSGGPRMSAFVPITSGGPSMGGPQPMRPTNRMGSSSVYSSSLSFPSMDSQHSDSEFSVVTDTSDECYPWVWFHLVHFIVTFMVLK